MLLWKHSIIHSCLTRHPVAQLRRCGDCSSVQKEHGEAQNLTGLGCLHHITMEVLIWKSGCAIPRMACAPAVTKPQPFFSRNNGENFSPTQDVHPALELKWPFQCELRRRFCSVGGYWYFGSHGLDLDKKQTKWIRRCSEDKHDVCITLSLGKKSETPTCWKHACTKFSGKRFRIRSNKASTLDTSSFFFPCPRLAFSLGFPGWISSTRTTPRTAAITVVVM